ncbi:MAG TPA: flagellar motor switch protein FliN [Bacillota bacterium]|nr:flagellar motor switch protein FliN [Bacillota bacterium]
MDGQFAGRQIRERGRIVLTEDEIRSFLAGRSGGEASVKKVQFPSLVPLKGMDRVKTSMSHLEDVQIELSVELGNASIKVRELLGLVEGSVIKLDKAVGDAVEVVLNNQPFARGEVVVINDTFGVRIAAVNRTRKSRLSEGLL